MNCCGTGQPEEFVYDDYTRMTVSSAVSHESNSSENSEVLNTDYRKVTPLFRNIERENWEGILHFLATGKWSNSMLSSSSAHLRCPAPAIQVKTWVTAYDRAGNAEWSQLPLHAAISYLAPYVVVQKLVEMYPKAIHCTDNEGMLPIHLAFGFGAPDNILALLLEPFPASVNEKGLGGRFPYECCELGPNKVRGRVYKLVTDQVILRTRQEIDHEWREFAIQGKKTVGLEGNLDVSNKQLTEFILELLKDKKELQDLKAKQRVVQQQVQEQTAAVMAAAASASAVVVVPEKPQTSPKATGKAAGKRLGSRTPRRAASTPKVAPTPRTGKVSGKKFSL